MEVLTEQGANEVEVSKIEMDTFKSDSGFDSSKGRSNSLNYERLENKNYGYKNKFTHK